MLDFKKDGATYDEYLTLYSCTESYKLFNKTSGDEITNITLMHKERDARRLEDPYPSDDTLTQWHLSRNIRKEYYHKERVQVFQRIDIDRIHRAIVNGKHGQVKDLP